MNINDMDDYTVNLADAYAKDAYQKGYEKGLEDGKSKQPLSSTEAFKSHCVHCFEEGYEQGKKDAVKHGYWKDFIYDCQCSVCGAEFDKCDNCLEDFQFCPNCGARLFEKE